jgi:hypothetical protein
MTAIAYTINPTDVNITRTNTVNLQNSVYNISYRINSVFRSNGMIKIIFPSTVLLSSGASCTYTIKYTNGTTTPLANVPIS